jgi:MFS family permease
MHDVLGINSFKRLWMAQVVSILGDFLALFGVINLITFKWHGTPLQVTNVMITYIIPLAVVGPLAGVFVDRWNVKRTMIASDLIRGVLTKGFSKKYVALSGLVGLAFATFVLALFQTAWLAGVSMFGIGFAIAFTLVPAQTLMQQETPREMLGRVSSSFFAVFSLSQLLGLVLSGSLANWIGLRPLFLASAILLVVLSSVGYLSLREDKPAGTSAAAAG